MCSYSRSKQLLKSFDEGYALFAGMSKVFRLELLLHRMGIIVQVKDKVVDQAVGNFILKVVHETEVEILGRS